MAKLTKEEYLQRIQEIGTCDDEVTRRGLLADLTDSASEIYDEYATAEEARKNAEVDNERLREANMKLFTRLGDHSEPEAPPTPEPPREKRKFENLFNDKGEIK